jgi:anti-sigma factor RsiW
MAGTSELQCVETRALLEKLLEADLPPEKRASVERHLAACPACATELAATERAIAELRALPRAEHARLRSEALRELGVADEPPPRSSRLARVVLVILGFLLVYYALRVHREVEPSLPRGVETR